MKSNTFMACLICATAYAMIVDRAAPAEGAPAAAESRITTPPASLEVDPFYTKYLDCGGLPILSSERVADAALFRAKELIDHMLADRDDVRKAMVDAGVRYVIIGAQEQTTDIPEYRHMKPRDYVNERARGFGGRIASSGEENLLCYPIDRYDDENILVHEFAHTIHSYGLRRIDKEFNTKLRALYDSAIEKGLWKNTYAGSNPGEYWAEGVQAYYDTNRENNWNHNHVSTREELEEYDPDLARFIAGQFRHTTKTDWRYKPLAPQPRVTTPPASLGCDAFYRKYVWCRSLPILASADASDEALLEANYVVRHMFAYRHDLLKAMIDDGMRLVILGRNEDLARIPEWSRGGEMKKPAGGARGADYDPERGVMVCAEENVLGLAGESVLIRRFAVAILTTSANRPVDDDFDKRPKQQYELRVERIDVRFRDRLERLYESAVQKGLWKGTAAAADCGQYWAEGVQSWFDVNAGNARPDGTNKPVNTREELSVYDPDLAKLIADVFLHADRTDWRYKKPSDR